MSVVKCVMIELLRVAVDVAYDLTGHVAVIHNYSATLEFVL